jgi:YegS/Rv2252/BmrU family lipid kinase
MEKIGILFNPSAGKGKALQSKERLERLLIQHEIDYDLWVTQSEDDLRRLVREKSERYKIIAGAGGDSTFNIIINEAKKKEVELILGMIGLGSSNDITKEFEIDSLEKACAALKRKKTKRIDLGCIIEDKRIYAYFLGQVNIGLGVLVNKYVENLAKKRPKVGRVQTLAGALGIIESYSSKKIPFPLTIESEKGRIEGRYILAVFNNIQYWATGKRVNPHARVDDGRLDCCLIKDCSFPRLVRLVFLSTTGKHTRAKEVDTFQSTCFQVSSEKPFEIQADGEIIGDPEAPSQFNRIEFKIIPQALDIIC